MKTFAPVLLLVALVLLLSCGKDRAVPGSGAVPSPDSSVSQGSAKDTPIAERLDEVIRKAKTTHRSLQAFIGKLFDDSLRQGQIIACGSYRLLMLTGHPQLDSSDEWGSFSQRLSVIALPSRFVNFTNGYYKMYISIPSALPYQSTLGAKSIELPWGLAKCGEDFKAPIPNGATARYEERQRFAQMIVRASLRLDYYSGKLPEIEAKASRALSLKASLEAVRGDLEVDLSPEMTEGKAREYEAFLNAAVESMSQWRKEAAVDILVKDDDIQRVLAIASGGS